MLSRNSCISADSLDSFFSLSLAVFFDAEGRSGPDTYAGRSVSANHPLKAATASGSYDSGVKRMAPSATSSALGLLSICLYIFLEQATHS